MSQPKIYTLAIANMLGHHKIIKNKTAVDHITDFILQVHCGIWRSTETICNSVNADIHYYPTMKVFYIIIICGVNFTILSLHNPLCYVVQVDTGPTTSKFKKANECKPNT